MKYDAFISYRHGELDGLVAEKLHKLLETYRIPNAIAKKVGKKRLSRVFRDREELPTSSNLSDSINDALENSDFLLLICSRRTCGSLWVMREVERFGELHGKDRIITLLIDGEPDESFPPGLREREVNGETVYVEPLAADIRAETRAGSIKRLKEEKLRLLAPVLGCAYDDLRRRHRRRRIQRIALGACAAFAFSLSFGAFQAYQYIRLDRQMQMKLENQSYVLAEYAARELADGDPETAMLLALEALPKNPDRPERPYVPAAEHALADALGVYDVTDGYKPYKTLALPAVPGELRLSPDERLAAAVCPYELTVFDTETARVAATLPTVRSVLAGAVFLSKTAVVFAGEDGLTAYDAADDTTLWRGESATEIAVSADGTKIAAVTPDGTSARLYAPDGNPRGTVDFGGRVRRAPPEGAFVNPRDAILELDARGTRLAASFADGSLVVFDIPSGAETELYPASEAVHFAGGFRGDLFAFAALENEPRHTVFTVENLADGARIARYEADHDRFIPCLTADGICVAFSDQILRVDEDTGALSHVASAGERIVSLARCGETWLAAEADGDYRFVGEDTLRIFSSSYACNLTALGARFALTGGYDSKILRILKKEDHSEANLLSYDRDYRFSEAKIHPARGRAVFYSYAGMRLFDLRGEPVAQVEFPNPEAVRNTEYDPESGNVIVLYENMLRLYSGLDGSLILAAGGDDASVFYTRFGVSVSEADGRVTLYDGATGAEVTRARTKPGSDVALPLGNGLLFERDGRVFFAATGADTDAEPADLGAGEIIGAGARPDFLSSEAGKTAYAFAVSDGLTGRVFFARDAGGAAMLTEGFTFDTHGPAEAYFAGNFVFVSPTHGDATAYRSDGTFVRAFSENGHMAEVGTQGEKPVASYVVAATSRRYSLLLDPESLDTTARLPGFLGETRDGVPVLDDGRGHLRAAPLLTAPLLRDAAYARLGSRTLTDAEATRFRSR